MSGNQPTFAAFERAGWEDPDVVLGYDRHMACVTSQCVPRLLEVAGLGSALRVLDVATGGGFVAAAAAAVGAIVVGTDMSSAQVRLASQRHPAIRFEVADAESLRFADESFDAVLCAFGLCHVPDPSAALREFRRVLATGGRVAYAVWDQPERVVGLGAIYRALRDVGERVDLPAGPDFFLLSDAGRSRNALLEAGFVDPVVTTATQVWRIADADAVFDVLASSSVRAGAALRAQSAASVEAIRGALREAFALYRCGDALALPMPALIASARKA